MIVPHDLEHDNCHQFLVLKSYINSSNIQGLKRLPLVSSISYPRINNVTHLRKSMSTYFKNEIRDLANEKSGVKKIKAVVASEANIVFTYIEAPLTCPSSVKFVCGEDGNSYRNSCFARRANTRIECNKKCPCKSSCTSSCSNTYQPVCDRDGKTFFNECYARCAFATVKCHNRCPCETSCTSFCKDTYKPVCGSDGTTYNNECLARCAGVTIECDKPCPCESCKCPNLPFQVCGADNKQYKNICFAKCANVDVSCIPNCPCQ
ncbi:Hypothetical predicted protein [Mytilus galloprovincialis]|uniref:Kazal-like domain-containing protein n=1 Tax=Mytilus galloprovincialis TaxID=29158 RepID=A0A8B6ETM1_MYTGA|nr:Hypothetical predicted protein [Mytilus galloprovincialis]